jgi:hypothetical protein
VKRFRTSSLFVGTCLFGVAWLANAQDAPAPAQAPAQTPAPAPAPPVWSVGPIDFSGLVDGYYDFNFNHPALGNQLYNFDVQANQFSLNMAKLSMSHTADPIGFQVDLGFGKAFEMIHFAEPAGSIGFLRNVEQAFVSWKPNKDKGLQLDFGQFVTSAGAEVIESHSNWNYSRSLLFSWAIPYYHFGARVTDTWGHFTGGFQVVNGWNNVEDNNSGKTIGIVGNITTKKLTWSNNYYTGPENPGTNKGFRNLYDTTVLLTPADKFNAYVNFDYGQNHSYVGKVGTTAEWYGIAGAAKLQFGKAAITPRIEWFKDRDGYETGICDPTATKHCGPSLKEFTLTYEYRWVEGLLSRIEYRHDWADQRIYQRGSTPPNSKSQDTLTIAMIAYFGPKR